MKIIKYYITHIKHGFSIIYLENDKRVEFDTWKEARRKIRELETKNLAGLFAWKKDEIYIKE